MKRALILAGLLALAACSQAPVPPVGSTNLSAQRMSTAADDRAVEVAVHTGSGAVYALTDAYSTDDSTGDYSSAAFLRRYNRSGAVVWQRQLGSGQNSDARALATDSSGNLYVSYNDRLEKRRSDGGVVWSRTVAGVSAVEADRNGNVYVGGGDEVENSYLRKYTGAGSLLWTRSLVQTRGIASYPTGIAADSSGNVYAVVRDIDDCCLWSTLVKHSSSGQQLMNKEIGASSGDVDLKDVVVVGNALYLAGDLHSSWDYNPDVPSDVNGLLIKQSLTGTEQWRRVFGTAEPDRVNGLAADSSGGLYLTGYTLGNFGSVKPGGSDVFLRKYSSSGQALWTKQIGSADDDAGNAVVAYSSGELYLAGEAGGALQGGTHHGGQDAFLRRTDGNGNRVWTDQ